jgi:hypothetical protein
MHNTYFETYNLLICPTTVAHVEQIRKGSYIGSRRWRIAVSRLSQLHPCLHINPTLTLPIGVHHVRSEDFIAKHALPCDRVMNAFKQSMPYRVIGS